MRGEHLVIVRNNKVQIKLPIRRNLTILQGKSATGRRRSLSLSPSTRRWGRAAALRLTAMLPAVCLLAQHGGATWRISKTASCLSMKTVRL